MSELSQRCRAALIVATMAGEATALSGPLVVGQARAQGVPIGAVSTVRYPPIKLGSPGETVEGQPIRIPVSVTEPAQLDVPIEYAVVSGADLVTSMGPFRVTIPRGQTSAVLEVPTRANPGTQSGRNVMVVAAPRSLTNLAQLQRQSATITDATPPPAPPAPPPPPPLLPPTPPSSPPSAISTAVETPEPQITDSPLPTATGSGDADAVTTIPTGNETGANGGETEAPAEPTPPSDDADPLVPPKSDDWSFSLWLGAAVLGLLGAVYATGLSLLRVRGAVEGGGVGQSAASALSLGEIDLAVSVQTDPGEPRAVAAPQIEPLEGDHDEAD